MTYCRETNHDRERNTGESGKVRYLGQTISANPALDKEIKKRIRTGWSTFGKHGCIINRNQPLSPKRKVNNLSVPTQCSETWHSSKEQKRKLRSRQKGTERKMFGVTWKDWKAEQHE